MSWKLALTSTLGNLGQNVQQGVASINLSDQTDRLTKSFATLSQTAREHLGTLNQDDVTELPEEYQDLERRVDALRNAHAAFLRVTKTYESETYDYPLQINESLTETASTVSHTLTTWASAATKGTNLPPISPSAKPETQHKTLSHALSRAATSGALELGGNSSDADSVGGMLGKVLKSYAMVQDKVGDARLEQDTKIQKAFLKVWQHTMAHDIQAAMKSRQAVKTARIALDAARSTLKHSKGVPKQSQACLEVENAEEKLVSATEEAIGLMKRVLEDPEPIQALSEMVKAQHAYHLAASEHLQGLIGEVEDTAVAAQSAFRKSRS